jgi:hypothetical protein
METCKLDSSDILTTLNAIFKLLVNIDNRLIALEEKVITPLDLRLTQLEKRVDTLEGK